MVLFRVGYAAMYIHSLESHNHPFREIDLSLFLTLVLAPKDEKDEGNEPETDSEFVDVKGIYHSSVTDS